SAKCIYRYDGSRFTIFKHDPDNKNSLAAGGISSVYADDEGLIWIGMQNGLDQYNPSTGVFTHYIHNKNDSTSVSRGITECPVLKDRKGRLWIGTQNGLDRMDIKSGKFYHYRNQKNNPKSLSCDIV